MEKLEWLRVSNFPKPLKRLEIFKGEKVKNVNRNILKSSKVKNFRIRYVFGIVCLTCGERSL